MEKLLPQPQDRCILQQTISHNEQARFILFLAHYPYSDVFPQLQWTPVPPSLLRYITGQEETIPYYFYLSDLFLWSEPFHPALLPVSLPCDPRPPDIWIRQYQRLTLRQHKANLWANNGPLDPESNQTFLLALTLAQRMRQGWKSVAIQKNLAHYQNRFQEWERIVVLLIFSALDPLFFPSFLFSTHVSINIYGLPYVPGYPLLAEHLTNIDWELLFQVMLINQTFFVNQTTVLIDDQEIPPLSQDDSRIYWDELQRIFVGNPEA
jgi:hypothetical protein